MLTVNKNNWFKNIPKPDYFIDLGPGVLNSEAWWAKKAWPNVKIIGLEASQTRFDSLKKNYPGTLLYRAISDYTGKLDMSLVDNMAVAHPIKKINGGTYDMRISKNFTIDCVSLDDLEQLYGPFKNVFVWADIEGAELDMLHGCTRLLNENKIIGFNLEIWLNNAGAKDWPLVQQIEKFLNRHGFKPKLTWQPNPVSHADIIYLK